MRYVQQNYETRAQLQGGLGLVGLSLGFLYILVKESWTRGHSTDFVSDGRVSSGHGPGSLTSDYSVRK